MQGSLISPSPSSAQGAQVAGGGGGATHACSNNPPSAVPAFHPSQGGIFVQFPPSRGHAHYLPRISDGISVGSSPPRAGGAAPLSSQQSYTPSSTGGGGGGGGDAHQVVQPQAHGDRGGGSEGGAGASLGAAGCTHAGGGEGGGRGGGGEERGKTDGVVVAIGGGSGSSGGDGAQPMPRGSLGGGGEGGEAAALVMAITVGESGGCGALGGDGVGIAGGGGGGLMVTVGDGGIPTPTVTPVKEKRGKKRKMNGGDGEGPVDEDGSEGSDDESDEAVTGQKKKKWTEAEIRHLVIVRCGMQQVKFKNQGNNKENWKIVASRMLENGFKRSSEQCRKKFERIWRKFQDLKADNERSGGLEFKGHGAGFPHVYDLIMASPMVSMRAGERSNHQSRSAELYHSDIPETLSVPLAPIHAHTSTTTTKAPRFSNVGSPGAETSAAVAGVLDDGSFGHSGPALVVGMPVVRPEPVDIGRHEAHVGSEGGGDGVDAGAGDTLDAEPGRDGSIKQGKFGGLKSRQVLMERMIDLLADMDRQFWESYDHRVKQQSELQRERAASEAMERRETNSILRSLVNRLIKEGTASNGSAAEGAAQR